MAKSAGKVPWTLLLFWTGLILTGDGVYAVTTWRQHAAVTFTATTGKIAQSALGQGALGRRGLRLRYTYTVNGVNFTGSRYRYDDANVSLRYSKVLDQYPAHTRRTIYYNPRSPQDSVLAPGVDGCDLLLLLVATPFNIATYAVWLALLGHGRKKERGLASGGLKTLRQDGQLRVRFAEMSGLEAGLFALGGAAAVGASAVIAIWRFDASIQELGPVWALTLTFAATAGICKWARNRSGRFDLRIDWARKTVTLPQTAGRCEAVTLTREAVAGVTTLRRVSIIPSGRHYTYLPALKIAGPGLGRKFAPLVSWGWSEERAVAFGQWLSAQIGAEFHGVEDELTSAAKPVVAFN